MGIWGLRIAPCLNKCLLYIMLNNCKCICKPDVKSNHISEPAVRSVGDLTGALAARECHLRQKIFLDVMAASSCLGPPSRPMQPARTGSQPGLGACGCSRWRSSQQSLHARAVGQHSNTAQHTRQVEISIVTLQPAAPASTAAHRASRPVQLSKRHRSLARADPSCLPSLSPLSSSHPPIQQEQL